MTAIGTTQLDLSGERTHINLSAAELVERALAAGEGRLAANGAIVCKTGDRTGRSPKDKYLEDTPGIHDAIWTPWEPGQAAFPAAAGISLSSNGLIISPSSPSPPLPISPPQETVGKRTPVVLSPWMLGIGIGVPGWRRGTGLGFANRL
jgi:hypothetical protein